MSNYTLTVNFSNEDLNRIQNRGQKIIIARSSDGQRPDVVWLDFDPLSRNSIEWEEEYGIYTSSIDLRNDAIIEKSVSVNAPVSSNQSYILESNGQIVSSPGGIGGDSFTVENKAIQMKSIITGLFQEANINGQIIPNNIVSAKRMIGSQSLSITPNKTVFILLGNYSANSYQSDLQNNALKLDFTRTNTITVEYKAQAGGFVIV